MGHQQIRPAAGTFSVGFATCTISMCCMSVVIAWMRDCLELWEEAGWDWAMWNFRGSFSILDGNRTDVNYQDVRGHNLDREMLVLVLAH